jgi:hypothetical protein
MKLFGTKKGDEKQGGSGAEEAGYFDSPVETVSLVDKPVATTGSTKVIVRDDPPPPSVDYGIDSAIQLMRALPVDQNVELVVQVIKTTLESLKVRVSDIIQDATRKQNDLEGRVTNLKREIGEFEKEIQSRKEEIARLETDHAETSSVKARLELAERAQKAASAKAAVSSAGAP